ncbi:MarR family transcriptional regulator [Novosphingobium ginsenosidimutans]|uniref:MarR family transcriptional regulator n=1 Tax=Novosphingobium ginsenosidimutans TaxID=1176536 RepID=A0A5B8S2B5_9SPHN|nr:MarR family transcriptional regulator [Novosphingobium ginsenosidimutans]QEA14995.1 MarR family transcriptional regulator [Novosphingobium ginsenosidimutans]
MKVQVEENNLQEQLRDLGAYLLQLADGRAAPRPNSEVVSLEDRSARPDGAPIDDSIRLRNIAREEYRRRRSRGDYFDEYLFAEPAWDILLDLYVAHVDEIRISVTSACLASSSPSTTALRWVAILEGQGLVKRTGDKADQRRTWVALTDLGVQKMTNYLRGKLASARPNRSKYA